MSDQKKKKKEYEPPRVKGIGGIFEQAMGASGCNTGGSFTAAPCGGGNRPAGNCPGGGLNQACFGGGGDTGTCSRGWFNTSSCSGGPIVWK